MEQNNRESWLNRVAAGMAPLFAALETPFPDRVRVAIGFTSWGAKGKAIGECWDNRRSGDGHFEIFIRPDLAHAPDAMPAQIAAILAHELVHAAVGIAAGQGKAFKRITVRLGLIGPMRATTPGDAFLAAVAPILSAAGPLPMPGSIPAARRPARHYARSRDTGRCSMSRWTATTRATAR